MIIIIIYKYCNSDESGDGLRTVGRWKKASQKDGRIFVDRMTDVFIEINSIHTQKPV